MSRIDLRKLRLVFTTCIANNSKYNPTLSTKSSGFFGLCLGGDMQQKNPDSAGIIRHGPTQIATETLSVVLVL